VFKNHVGMITMVTDVISLFIAHIGFGRVVGRIMSMSLEVKK